jgi:hypothetical protein
MKRVGRILLNAATAVSLVACQVGVIAWWAGLIGGRHVSLLTLLAAAAIAARVARDRLRPAADAQAVPCLHCGYDLRATPDRCPECGHLTPRDGPAHARTAG